MRVGISYAFDFFSAIAAELATHEYFRAQGSLNEATTPLVKPRLSGVVYSENNVDKIKLPARNLVFSFTTAALMIIKADYTASLAVFATPWFTHIFDTL